MNSYSYLVNILLESDKLDDRTKINLTTCTEDNLYKAIRFGLNTLEMLPEIANHVPSVTCREVAIEQTSSLKGAYGEKYVKEILGKEFNVKAVSKTSKTGDILLRTAGSSHDIMVEVKYYKNSVPSAEVEKFYRDLSSCRAHGGVFISLGSSINTIGDFVIKYEFIDSVPIPVVFINSTDEMLIINAIRIIDQMIMSKQHLVNDVYSRDKVREIAMNITERVESLGRTRSNLHENMNSILRLLSKTYDCMTTDEINIRETTKQLESELIQEEIIIGGVEPYLGKYNPKNQDLVIEISKKINNDRHNITESSWKLLKTKAVHIGSNSGFNFMKTKTEFFTKFTQRWQEFMMKHLTMCTINSSQMISIVVSDETFDDIMSNL